jgi:hypothetical protein
MPAFSFEKLPPPIRRESVPAAKPQRGLIIQMLDRLTEARLRRMNGKIADEISRKPYLGTRRS